MNIRVIPRTAVSSYLKLARVPLDAATRLLPGQKTGPGPAAKLAVDRADATARAVAGRLLRDPALREDARRRQEAASERQRAVELRARAERATEQADERLEERHQRTRGRRKQADARAEQRRQRAESEKQRKQKQAATSERQRVQNSRTVEEKVQEKIDRDEPKERLEVLEAKSEAQQERGEALTARDEAQRLGEAAAKVKAERKQS